MEEWGLNFSHIIHNEKDKSKPPTNEDVDYILDKFIDAVEERGLICGGGCSPTRLDIVVCDICHKSEADIEWEMCSACLDKLARKHGYSK